MLPAELDEVPAEILGSNPKQLLSLARDLGTTALYKRSGVLDANGG